jgi:hypothetical protein
MILGSTQKLPLTLKILPMALAGRIYNYVLKVVLGMFNT